jgi:hypothetical protein
MLTSKVYFTLGANPCEGCEHPLKMGQFLIAKGTLGLKVAAKPLQGSVCPKTEMHLS